MLVMSCKSPLTPISHSAYTQPKLFNILTDVLSWIVEAKDASLILHYLEDFLTIGPPTSITYQESLNIIRANYNSWANHRMVRWKGLLNPYKPFSASVSKNHGDRAHWICLTVLFTI